MDLKRIAAFFTTIVIVFGIAIYTTPGLLDKINLGLDLRGGFEILYKAEPMEEGAVITPQSLKETALSLAERADALGVAEPEVETEGRDRIRVSLAGVENEREVREIMSKPAELTFRSSDGCSSIRDYCKIELRGVDFKENAAEVFLDELHRPVVSIEVKDKQKFAEVTGRLIGRPLAIYLDDRLLQEPTVQGVFTDGKATITGQDTRQEAEQLRDIINLGALPLKLTELYTQKVGPSLGQMSLEETMRGALIGSILILVFMLAYYRLPGIVAAVSLIFFTWVLLLLFHWMGVTVTLPGIAAFVLAVGMAVDANIITYERIKEELRTGKSPVSALKSGSKHSLRTIIDANLTTIFAALALFLIGRGSVKGFAIILIFSIVVSMATNVLFARMLLSFCIRGFSNIKPQWFGVKPSQIADIKDKHASQLNVESRFDFAGKAKIFYLISTAILVVGMGAWAIFSLNYGVDFSAGTRVDASVQQQISKAEIDEQLAALGLTDVKVNISGEQSNQVSLRFKEHLSVDQEHAVSDLLGADHVEVNTVDPTIANELRVLAVYAVLLACLLIVIYIAFRFEWRFSVGAILTTLHDALFIIGIFAIFRLEVNLPFIIAVLTIIGYSINDTVVIFDRIRENMRFAKIKNDDDLKEVVNRSIWQTLTRSINTVLTILFPAVCLLVFGSESLRMFSLAIVIGLIAGVYSSIFIASPIWRTLKARELAARRAAIAAKE